ncbi:30S ribosomal protein S16 [Candidatus Parcubacteria bacterium]|nr:30S ribosomal protein S16 [Candidatus Parcubacteria bacterium]
MLKIRLSRIGKKKKAMYRLIINEHTRDTYGRALEILGSYNPFTKKLETKKERIEHWLKNGAQMSPTVNNLLLENKIIKGEKVIASSKGKKAVKAEKEAKQTKPSEKKETKEKKENEVEKSK